MLYNDNSVVEYSMRKQIKGTRAIELEGFSENILIGNPKLSLKILIKNQNKNHLPQPTLRKSIKNYKPV